MFETIGILIKAVFDAITGVSKAVEKRTLPDQVIIDNANRVKVRKEQAEMVKIFDNAFRRLKNHPELNIRDNVRLVDGNLPDDQEELLVSQLYQRIFEWRSKPVRRAFYKSWILEQKEIHSQKKTT